MTQVQTVQALASRCMAFLNQCRAAVRRWGVGAAFALQIRAGCTTRHQTKARAEPLRTLMERFAPTAPIAENRLGAREATVYAVPPLPPLPPLQMSTPRSQTPGGMRCVGSGGWLASLAGRYGFTGWRGGTPISRYFRIVAWYGSKRARSRVSDYFFR